MPETALYRTYAEALRPLLNAAAPQTIAQLCALVRIPSVSWEGYDPEQPRRSAETVSRQLDHLGIFDSVQVLAHADGAPAVVARREPAPGRPTVLLYAHHDVQPPGAESAWQSNAFDPVVRSGRLYGRGSADDKAGIAVHLAALRAVTQHLGKAFELGLVVFVEGEEETGSPTFQGFLNEHARLLQSDLMVVADSDNPSVDRPAVTTSLRGNVTGVLRVKTLDHALHSGMFGGAAPDALAALVRILASFYDEAGALRIPGLHRVPSGDAGEEAVLPAEAGLLEGVEELGTGSLADRLWRQPALTITGVEAPSIDQASNTLLPEAAAKLSLRVAPGDTAASALAALREHIRAHAPWGAHWSFEDVSLGEPFLQSPDSLGIELARGALEAGFGAPAIDQGVGGSIPFIAWLKGAFPSAQVIVTGVEDPDTRAHSPNESLHLGVLWRQALSEATLLAVVNHRQRSDFAGAVVVE